MLSNQLVKPHMRRYFPCLLSPAKERCSSDFELQLRSCGKTICCSKCKEENCKDLCVPETCVFV